MATRRNTVLTEIDEDENIMTPGVPALADPDIEAPDLEIMSALAEIGGADSDAKVMIFRLSKDRGSRDSYVCTYTPGEFTLDCLKENHGGGEFRVRIVSQGGKFIKNRVVNVEKQPDKPVGAAPDTQAISQLAQVMTQGFQELGRMMVQLATPKDDSRKSMLEEMLMYKQLFGGGERQDNSMSMLEALKTGVEIAKSAGGNGGGEDNENTVISKLIDTFGGPIAEAVMKGNAHEATAPPALPNPASRPAPASGNQPAPNPSPIVAPSPTNKLPESEDMKNNFMIKQAVGFLCNQAAKNNDPYTYAAMVLDQVDEATILQIIDTPDYLDRLAGFNPAVKSHAEWFAELRDAIKEILTAPPESGISPETPGGDDNAVGGRT